MNKKNRCKICGYRFKSSDEIICPECLTARENDISCSGLSSDLHSDNLSCNNFSDDLHSHNLGAVDSYFGQPENDTFKEEKNDFISEERRDEQKDKNFRSPDYSAAQQNYYAGNPQPQNVTGNSRQQKLDAIRNSNANFQNRIISYNNPAAFNAANFNRVSGRKKSGCMPAVVTFIIIVIAFIAIIVSVTENSYNDHYDDYTDDYTYSYEDYDYDYDYDDDSDYMVTKYSEDGTYSIQFSDCYLEYLYSDELTEEEKESILTGINDYSDWYDVNIVLSSKMINSDRTVGISTAYFYAYDDQGNILNYSTSVDPALPTEKTGDEKYCLDFLVSAEASRVEMYVTFEDENGKQEFFVFKENLDYYDEHYNDESDNGTAV